MKKTEVEISCYCPFYISWYNEEFWRNCSDLNIKDLSWQGFELKNSRVCLLTLRCCLFFSASGLLKKDVGEGIQHRKQRTYTKVFVIVWGEGGKGVSRIEVSLWVHLGIPSWIPKRPLWTKIKAVSEFKKDKKDFWKKKTIRSRVRWGGGVLTGS